LDARMILLPLKSDLGDVSRILGCLVSVGDLGVAPRRFDVRQSNLRRLGRPVESVDYKSKPKLTKPLPATASTSDVVSKGFEEAQRQFLNAQSDTSSTPKAVPYLRLVKTDD